jgi:hypothetical protein
MKIGEKHQNENYIITLKEYLGNDEWLVDVMTKEHIQKINNKFLGEYTTLLQGEYIYKTYAKIG